MKSSNAVTNEQSQQKCLIDFQRAMPYMEPRAFKRFVDKLTKENLWIYIVKTLMDGGEKTGYEIVKSIKSLGISTSTVNVYMVLYKMERDGLIKSDERSDGKYYKNTQLGVATFNNALQFLDSLLEKLGCELRCLS